MNKNLLFSLIIFIGTIHMTTYPMSEEKDSQALENNWEEHEITIEPEFRSENDPIWDISDIIHEITGSRLI